MLYNWKKYDADDIYIRKIHSYLKSYVDDDQLPPIILWGLPIFTWISTSILVLAPLISSSSALRMFAWAVGDETTENGGAGVCGGIDETRAGSESSSASRFFPHLIASSSSLPLVVV